MIGIDDCDDWDIHQPDDDWDIHQWMMIGTSING
jgi:hypothetical protein